MPFYHHWANGGRKIPRGRELDVVSCFEIAKFTCSNFTILISQFLCLVVDGENRENFDLEKLSHYMVLVVMKRELIIGHVPRNISTVCSMFLWQHGCILCWIAWFMAWCQCLCLASSTREQKVFRGRNVHARKTSWAGVWRQKQQKLSPHKKIPYLQCQCNQNTLQNNARLLPGLPHMQRCMTSCMFTNSRGQQRCWCPMYFGVWADEFV